MDYIVLSVPRENISLLYFILDEKGKDIPAMLNFSPKGLAQRRKCHMKKK